MCSHAAQRDEICLILRSDTPRFARSPAGGVSNSPRDVFTDARPTKPIEMLNMNADSPRHWLLGAPLTYAPVFFMPIQHAFGKEVRSCSSYLPTRQRIVGWQKSSARPSVPGAQQ